MGSDGGEISPLNARVKLLDREFYPTGVCVEDQILTVILATEANVQRGAPY